MNIVSQILEVIRTNARHKRYEKELEVFTKTASISTPIKSENDHSDSFKRW